jgi:hypothetical protein
MAILEGEKERYQHLSFDQFLDLLDINLERYILAIRSCIQSNNKVYLKRTPRDVFMNGYSEKILRLHRANMGVQFVIDAYACCGYVVDYINKADRGISAMIDRAYHELQAGNQCVATVFKNVMNLYYNHSEVCAQEAAYNLLWLPMVTSSSKVVYISIEHPEKNTPSQISSSSGFFGR